MKLIDLFTSQKLQDYTLYRPYVIAEAGVNHDGSMELAKRLIDEAAEGGADAIKFQTYKANSIAIKNSPAYWDLKKEPTASQYNLFLKYDKFWKNEFETLKRYCEIAGIEFLSTPFDLEAADFLNDLMDVFKVSSSDITNLPFIEHICAFGKPILLSTGASFLHEIQEAADLIEENDLPYCLMHCVLNYPTNNEDANLGMLLGLKSKFPNALLGYSDHTCPDNMEVVIMANLLGARIIEKHFTYDKSLMGNDHYHAMDMNDLKTYRNQIEKKYEILGAFKKGPLPTEMDARKYARRSLVAKRDIMKGQAISPDDLTWKRPGTGISPKYFKHTIHRKALVDISEDETIQWNMLS